MAWIFLHLCRKTTFGFEWLSKLCAKHLHNFIHSGAITSKDRPQNEVKIWCKKKSLEFSHFRHLWSSYSELRMNIQYLVLFIWNARISNIRKLEKERIRLIVWISLYQTLQQYITSTYSVHLFIVGGSQVNMALNGNSNFERLSIAGK